MLIGILSEASSSIVLYAEMQVSMLVGILSEALSSILLYFIRSFALQW